MFVADGRRQEFQMDSEIVEDLQQQRQDALDAVCREMAWQEEKCRIVLDKLHSRFVRFFCGYT